MISCKRVYGCSFARTFADLATRLRANERILLPGDLNYVSRYAIVRYSLTLINLELFQRSK